MTQTQNGSICAEEYVVKRGDSFYLIAHKLGVPLRDLLAANRDIHPARLMVGDVLCIPREEDDRPQGGNIGSGNAGGSAGNSGSTSAGNVGTANGNTGSGSTTTENSSNAGTAGSTSQQGGSALSNGSAGTSSGTSSTENAGNANNAGNAGSSNNNAADNGNASNDNTGSSASGGSSSGSTSTGGTVPNGSPIVTPPPATPVPGLACPIEEQVTIAQGQTIADIQLQNLLSRNTLQTANPALDLDSLEAGQTICVPTENIACRLPSTYTLAAGETLEAVAMRFNLPLGSLLRVNPCLAPQDFEEGVTVILPR